MTGIFLINKEKDKTSREIVNQIEKKFKVKAGHAGTLDPLATGLLIVLVNRATIINEIVTGYQKEYLASARLGLKTDTGDITGEVIDQSNKKITENGLKTVINNFPSKYIQEVPIYSAVKVAGQRLYDYAREKKEVKIPKREVNIYHLELISFNQNEFIIKTLVSKGTYIRSLIEDIAKNLNTCATMTGLIRTKQGNFDLEQAKDLEQITESDLISIKEVLQEFPTVQIKKEKIKDGQLIENLYQEEKVLLIDQNEALAIYQTYEKNKTKMKPWKMFI